MKKQLKVSVLDLVPVREGQQNKEAIEHMTRLIQKVEQYGYERYWIAEHHNIVTIDGAIDFKAYYVLQRV